mgnify:CR=1 FL=1
MKCGRLCKPTYMLKKHIKRGRLCKPTYMLRNKIKRGRLCKPTYMLRNNMKRGRLCKPTYMLRNNMKRGRLCKPTYMLRSNMNMSLTDHVKYENNLGFLILTKHLSFYTPYNKLRIKVFERNYKGLLFPQLASVRGWLSLIDPSTD